MSTSNQNLSYTFSFLIYDLIQYVIHHYWIASPLKQSSFLADVTNALFFNLYSPSELLTSGMCRPPFKIPNEINPTFSHWISCFTHKYVRLQRTFHSVFMNHDPIFKLLSQINQWKSMCGISRVCVRVCDYILNVLRKCVLNSPSSLSNWQ